MNSATFPHEYPRNLKKLNIQIEKDNFLTFPIEKKTARFPKLRFLYNYLAEFRIKQFSIKQL